MSPRRLLGGTVALVVGASAFVVGPAASSVPPASAAEPAGQADQPVGLTPLGGYQSDAGAEISAFDPATDLLYVGGGGEASVDLVDVSNPAAPTKVTTVDLSAYGASFDSVAVSSRGFAAVVLADDVKSDPGRIVLLGADGTVIASATVGALPDMVTFTDDGSTALVANEGEPDEVSEGEWVDPPGSVSVVDVPLDPAALTDADVRTADFDDFTVAGLRADGVRISNAIADDDLPAATDLEPEYITVEGGTAYVTLQENDAVAVVDVETATVTGIEALGTKDHLAPGMGLDTDDKDGMIAIDQRPVRGLYMPDAIAHYSIGDNTYLVTANEGDGRDYPGYIVDEARIKDLDVAPSEELETLLGDRLTVTTDFPYDPSEPDQLYSFGGRSVSIWSTDGEQLWDSGDQFARIVAAQEPAAFNGEHDDPGAPWEFDNRSDNKGTEPEGVTVGRAYGRTYAFVALERQGGLMMYDVTDPSSPTFVEWENSTTDYTTSTGDLAPEGLQFVQAVDSPTGRPLVIASNEDSKTVRLYEVAGPVATGAAAVTSLAPERVLDTRTGAIPAAGSTVNLKVAGEGEVPGDGSVSAVVLNLVATEATTPAYVTAFASDQVRPGTSSLNIAPGQIQSAQVTVPVGADGSVNLFVQNPTHLVADVVGYYQPTAAPTSAGRTEGSVPVRALDTRDTGQRLSPGQTLDLDLSSFVPADATAAVLTVTGVDTAGPGWLSVRPAGTPFDGTSSLNFDAPGDVVANQVLARLSDDQTVTVQAGSTSADVVVDVTGYVTGEEAPAALRGLFVAASSRLIDTRSAPGAATGVVPVTAAGTPGVPASGVGGLAVNVTLTETSSPMWAAALPVGAPTGTTSTVNATQAGQTVAAPGTVFDGTELEVALQWPTELVVDLTGWYVGDADSTTIPSDPDGAGRLTLMHNNDGESSLLPLTNSVTTSGVTDVSTAADVSLPVGGVSAFAAVTDREIADARLRGNAVLDVYAGDAFLASATLVCSQQPGAPVYDAVAQSQIPYDLHVFGNHEFDFGTGFLGRFVRGFDTDGSGQPDQPFLSANLDFDADGELSGLVDPQDPISMADVSGGKVIGSSMVHVDEVTGQRFGVVAATTWLLPTISSPGDVVVTSDDLASTAAVVQREVDRLTRQGVRKVVLVSHLQDLANDQAMTALLHDVDVVVTGGGDELLANDESQLLPGEGAEVYGPYPMQEADATGKVIPLVTTSGNYKYVGRLDVAFDSRGDVVAVDTARSFPRRVVPESAAATELGVFDAVTPDPALVASVDEPVADCIDELAATVVATSEQDLNVSRGTYSGGVASPGVRTTETNGGDLVADAYLAWYDGAAAVAGNGLSPRSAANPVVAVQNGGGIRQNAGDVLPNNAEDVVSRLDTLNLLPFDNRMAVVREMTPTELKEVFERSASTPGGGQFLQVGGVKVTLDYAQTAQVISGAGVVTTPGSRVRSIQVVNPDGSDGAMIVDAGAVVPGAPTVDVVTNQFTAGGGDNYPWFSTKDIAVFGTTYEQVLVDLLSSFPEVGGEPAVPAIYATPQGRITQQNLTVS